LLFLEQDESESIIVAATNHPVLLDHALFRRFDSVIEYVLPSRESAEKVIRARLALLDTSHLDWSRVLDAVHGLSHAEVARASEHAAKKAILAHRTRMDTSEVIEALKERMPVQRK
jgi:AAA+ superfamily predicted ATPase